jgi:predicted nucleic acid-binding Zn ribbon protein
MADEAKRPLEDIVKGIIGNFSGKDKLTEEEIRSAWEVVVGSKAAKHSRPRAFTDSRLIVHVDDSSWLYELTTQKKYILNNLSAELKGKKLKDITFRIGDLR